MGDDEKNFDINIRSKYDGTGAKEAQADLVRTAEAGAGAGKQTDFGKLAAERAAAEKFIAAASAETLGTETQKAILQERQLVVATQRAMLEAKNAGDATELVKLQAELAVRQLTIKTLQTEAMTQTEINALLVEQDALIAEGTAAAALRAEAMAAEAGALGFHEIRAGAHAFHGLEQAMEKGTMSARTFHMTLHGLYELLIANPWVAVATAIGSAALAFGIWIKKSAEAREKLFEDLEATAKKSEETAAEIKKAAEEAKFDALKAELDETEKKFEALNQAAKQQLAYLREMAGLDLSSHLADLDIKEQEELKGAEGNELKIVEIRASYANARVAARATTAKEIAKKETEEAMGEQELLKAQRAYLIDRASQIQGTASPAETDYIATKKTLQASAAVLEDVGMKSDERDKLDRLAELEGNKGNLSLKEKEELYRLHEAAPELKRKSVEAPTFNKDQMALFKAWAAQVEGAKDQLQRSDLPEDKRKALETNLPTFEAAEKLLQSLGSIDTDKSRAEEARKKQEKARQEVAEELEKVTKKLDEASRKVVVAQAKEMVVTKQGNVETVKTTASGQKEIDHAEESTEEEKKREAEKAQKEAGRVRKAEIQAGLPGALEHTGTVTGEAEGFAKKKFGNEIAAVNAATSHLKTAQAQGDLNEISGAIRELTQALAQVRTSNYQQEAARLKKDVDALKNEIDKVKGQMANNRTP